METYQAGSGIRKRGRSFVYLWKLWKTCGNRNAGIENGNCRCGEVVLKNS
nr:MAG TPA: hypothetical protein [Caudoviricetes sp.]